MISYIAYIAAAGGYTFINAEAEALVAAFSVDPDDTRKALIDNLVGTLKGAGVWTKIDYLYVMAAHDEQAARINWKDPGTATLTVVNSPTFTTDGGFASNGSTSYLDSGVPYASLNLSLNDMHVGGRWSGTLPSGGNVLILGRANSNGRYMLADSNVSGHLRLMIRSATAASYEIGSNAGAVGNALATRRGASETEGYTNGASVGADTRSPESVGSDSSVIGVSNGLFSTAGVKHQVAHWGTQLTDAEASDVSDALDTYFAGLLTNDRSFSRRSREGEGRIANRRCPRP